MVFLKHFNYSLENTCIGSRYNEDTDFKVLKFNEKRLQTRYDSVSIEKRLRTPILKNTCKRLLLYTVSYCEENGKNKHLCIYSVTCKKP